jgi:hypothetical protein
MGRQPDEVTNGRLHVAWCQPFFDLPHLGFTAAGDPDNGVLTSDRPHVFNAYGSYELKWTSSGSQRTNFAFFTTAVGPPDELYTGRGRCPYGRGDRGRIGLRTPTADLLPIRIGNNCSLAFELNVLNLFTREHLTA